MEILVDIPVIIRRKKGLLKLPYQDVTHPLKKPNAADSMQSVRDGFRNRGFSEETTSIFMQSWKPGTKNQYNTFIKRFSYCGERKVAPLLPALEAVIEFVTEKTWI